jgi:hypothetical protein
MPLDTSRIESVIDVPRLAGKKVAIVGLGGAAKLACDLARCGVEQILLIDFDTVEPSNVARQDHAADHIGWPKVEAAAAEIGRVNPDAQIVKLRRDFCGLTPSEIRQHFAGVDALVMATDSFPAQARGNELALRLGIPAVWIALYEGGQAGEIVWWHPGLDSCFRCLCTGRYRAYENGIAAPVTSRGACIFDIRLPDSIAGMIVIGLLTRGAPNRFGRLIGQLGNRQFLQIKIDPLYGWNGRDIFREQLGIADGCDPYFSFVTIARSDPDHGRLPCPDCERFRGHRFQQTSSGYRRIKHSAATASNVS